MNNISGCIIFLIMVWKIDYKVYTVKYIYDLFFVMKKILLVLIWVISPIILIGCGKEVDPNEWGKLETFVSCVTDKWLKMYGTDWCPHCQKMKKMFGSAFSGINFINCDQQKIQCDVAKIEWFPTWEFNDQKYPGEKTLQELSSLTSCTLPVETPSK